MGYATARWGYPRTERDCVRRGKADGYDVGGRVEN
jgi:hypothetical protein